MNVKRALEMLQAELWLAVSMRKKEKKKKQWAIFLCESFSAVTRFDFLLSLRASVCLFGHSSSKPRFASSAILTPGGAWKSVQRLRISLYWMFFFSRW